MSYLNEYISWIQNPSIIPDPVLKKENLAQIEDRFYKKLEFGTAGMRGKLGDGTNRMNVYVVAELTKGIADKIISENKQNDGVVIGYDVRHMSKEFAKLSAAIFYKKGIKTYLFNSVTATPILSYAIRDFKAATGIMITASHNPKEYNGYKVYGSNGIQILQDEVDKINEFVSKLENPYSINEYKLSLYDLTKIHYIGDDFISKYLKEIEKLSINPVKSDLKTVYTALNGTGFEFVKRMLLKTKSTRLYVVKEQIDPDPDFTTVGIPNPEEESSFDLAKELGNKIGADLLLATDPDSDRVGAMVKHEGLYHLLTGNVLGTLLTNYILSQMKEQNLLNEKSSIVKTIVTNNLVDKVASSFGVQVHDVHVGFKNIYSLVEKWEKTNEADYILGYEESYGFGIGKNIARDKDAISATMLIVEMTAYYHNQGKTLVDVLNEIQNKYGYYVEKASSIVLEGPKGLSKMQEIVEKLRNNPIKSLCGSELSSAIDYLEPNNLGQENVLKYVYENGSWFVVRPSGTEPKLKLYMYAVSNDRKNAESLLEKMSEEIKKKLEE